jgi:ABC-type transport system involved in cytochrome bd biosynthesis fused ATPase/permease subunit
MLDIIRFIKINAIEKFFFLKVNEKRMKEIHLYKKKGLMDVMSIFIYWLACPLILSVTFFTYIKLGNEMNSQVAFTTIMIFSILQYPIRLLPSCISEMIQIFASVKRIEKYLLAEERKTENIVHIVDDDNPVAIRIERGDFYWGF